MTSEISKSKEQDWRYLLANAITSPNELIDLLELPSTLLDEALLLSKRFPLRVPRGFVKRMKKGDINDPLLRQVLPLGLELLSSPLFEGDPLQELKKNPLPGLLHKFYGRVLLIFTGVCAINCRYCFRQHFPYSENNPGKKGWQEVINYINQEETISEVILSGGDPLIAPDQSLKDLVQQLSDIPHVKRLRIHSRIPVVLPERITDELISWIKDTRLKTTLVIHCNHAQEINIEVKESLLKLAAANVTLLNQAVLLKDVNDNILALTDLSETLFDSGVLPYYLFTLDKVLGAMHFDLPLSRAKELHQELTHRLPGYLVPKLAKEEPGALAKVLL